MNWKDPAVAAQLRKLWNEGHSCSTIAAIMGAVSRNAVIGAVRRHHLPFRGHSGNGSSRGRHKTGNYDPKRSPCSTAYQLDKRVFGDRRPDIRLTTKAVESVLLDRPAIKTDGLPLPMPTADDKARVSFIDLEPYHCKWPVGDTLNALPTTPVFCGLDRMPGSSYCVGHHARATVPVAPRQREFRPPADNVVPMPKREPVAA